MKDDDFVGSFLKWGALLAGIAGVVFGFMEGGIGGSIAFFLPSVLCGAMVGFFLGIWFELFLDLLPLLVLFALFLVLLFSIYALAGLLWDVGKP